MTRSFRAVLKFFILGLVAVLISTACKQSVAEKNKSIVSAAMPEMMVQKDSLAMATQATQKEFEVLKSKVDQLPDAVKKSPEYADLSDKLQGIMNKSAFLDKTIPGIESKLDQLSKMDTNRPAEEIEHEIVAMKELLQIQRGKMANYVDYYKKLGIQLDSIQQSSK